MQKFSDLGKKRFCVDISQLDSAIIELWLGAIAEDIFLDWTGEEENEFRESFK